MYGLGVYSQDTGAHFGKDLQSRLGCKAKVLRPGWLKTAGSLMNKNTLRSVDVVSVLGMP